MRQARGDLLRRRLVVGRRTADRGRDERVAQLSAHRPAMLRGGDVRETGAMQRGHQEVAGPADAVAGEDAAGAVGAVRGRRQPDDQQARARIAEPGHRSRPVGVVAKGPALLAADPLAVLPQPRTPLARRRSRSRDGQPADPGCASIGTRFTRRGTPARRTIGASALHENAFWNSGMFDTTPLTR